MLATATARKPIKIGRTTYYYNQPDQYTYQFEFEDGRYLGQITRVPQSAHEKEHYIPGTTGEHKPFWREATEALIREYWETQAMQVRATPAPEPEIPATFRELPAPEPEPAPPAEQWYTLAEAARRLNVSDRTIRNRMRDGAFTYRSVVSKGARHWEILWPGAEPAAAIARHRPPLHRPTPKAVAPPPAVQLPPAAPPKNGHIAVAPVEEWYTLAEVAKRLGVSASTIHNRMRDGAFTYRSVVTNGNRHWEILWPGAERAAAIAPHLSSLAAPIPTKGAGPQAHKGPEGWIRGSRPASEAYHINDRTIRDWRKSGKVASVEIGGVYWYAPPGTPAPEPAPVAKPEPVAPEPAPLSDFPSPTIEVQHTTGADDHPLDSPPAAVSDDRLLTAMQRIGYLESQVEHWRAHAHGLEQRLAECQTKRRWWQS